MKTSNDDRFFENLDLLNTLMGAHPWQEVRAKKDHIDEFGDKIAAGDSYYRREYGVAYHEVVKVSRRSMEIMLYAVLRGNRLLRDIARNLKEKQEKELAGAMKDLNL
jgi:hypothetical protein